MRTYVYGRVLGLLAVVLAATLLPAHAWAAKLSATYKVVSSGATPAGYFVTVDVTVDNATGGDLSNVNLSLLPSAKEIRAGDNVLSLSALPVGQSVIRWDLLTLGQPPQDMPLEMDGTAVAADGSTVPLVVVGLPRR